MKVPPTTDLTFEEAVTEYEAAYHRLEQVARTTIAEEFRGAGSITWHDDDGVPVPRINGEYLDDEEREERLHELLTPLLRSDREFKIIA